MTYVSNHTSDIEARARQRDWQTTDNMSAASRVMAKRHLETLREAGLIEIESAPPRGNFVKKPL